MNQALINSALALLAMSLASCANHPTPAPSNSTESRAVAFLQREVPAWSRDNSCYSCHNNGDGARALFTASQKGFPMPQVTLADTTAWVAVPANWDHNQGDPGFSDQRLADVQFAAALAAAVESGSVKDQQAMKVAGLKVASGQTNDGSWPIDVANPVGSPTTYGATLATYMAWDSLRRVALPETIVARYKAEERLSAIKTDSVPNAAVLLLFLAKNREAPSLGQTAARSRSNAEADGVRDNPQRLSLSFLRSAQTSDGGWGPYADSPPEAFDTALALLALAEFRTGADVPEMIRRGREFLITTQLTNGSWPATTRPSGGQSYAQQLSTTGWVVLALLATR